MSAMIARSRLPDSSFNGDYASRYSLKKGGFSFVNAVPPPPGSNGSPQKEANLRDDISEGPENSVASWVWNFDQLETRLKALAGRGKFAEAQDVYRQINEVIDENFDGILALTRAGFSGPLGEQIAARAARIVNGSFAEEPVQFLGQQLPLSAVLMDGGEMAAERARDEFESIGLSGKAADMLFTGTDRQRAVMRSLVTPLLGGQAVPDRLQRVDLAESVVDNWDDYESVFGEGLPYVVDRIQAAHTGAGGAADTLKTLTSYARSVGASRGIEGRALAKDVMGAYSGLMTQAFARDADPRGGPSKGTVQVEESPTRRMMFDAALASAVRAMDARGVSADLKSPAFAKALTEVLDAQAYASNFGIDLIGLGHDTGRSAADAFGEYVADSVTLSPEARNRANPIAAFQGLRNMMNQMITGGNDFAQQVFNVTGSAENYLNSVDRSNSGYSSSPGADAMAASIKGYLMKAMAPGIMAGMSPGDALNMASTGTPHARTDFILGLSDTISSYFTGPDRKQAGDYLAARAMETVESGNKLSVQDLIYDVAFGSDVDEDNLPSSVRALRDWYNGNVTSAVRFAQPATALLAHYREDEGLPDLTARSLVAKTLAQASTVERRGLNADRLFQARMNVGTIYRPDPNYVNPDGSLKRADPLTGGEVSSGGMYVIRPVLDDRSRRGPDGNPLYGYNGDDVAWNNQNNAYRQMYREGQALQKAALQAEMRKQINEDS